MSDKISFRAFIIIWASKARNRALKPEVLVRFYPQCFNSINKTAFKYFSQHFPSNQIAALFSIFHLFSVTDMNINPTKNPEINFNILLQL